MSKLQLACVAAAVWASSTCASPFAAQENAPEYGGATQTFKCKAIEHNQNRIVAADLHHTVIVSLKLKEKRAAELSIVYVDDNGVKSTASGETKPWHLVTVPNRHDYSWYAMANYHPNLLMHGRLFEEKSAHNPENRWFYNEEQFEHGLKTIDYQTTCSKEG